MEDVIKEERYNQGYLATIKYEKQASNTVYGHPQDFFPGVGNEVVWRTEVPQRGSRGRTPVGALGQIPQQLTTFSQNNA